MDTFQIIISCILLEHWTDAPEFITRTVESWNRWIRLESYYNRASNTCQL